MVPCHPNKHAFLSMDTPEFFDNALSIDQHLYQEGLTKGVDMSKEGQLPKRKKKKKRSLNLRYV